MTGAIVVLYHVYLLFTSSDFYHKFGPALRGFQQAFAMEIEKIKAPLFQGPEGAGNTNGWCICKLPTAGMCHI